MPKTIKLTFADDEVARIEKCRKAYNKGKRGSSVFMTFKQFVYTSVMCDIQTLEMAENEDERR